MMRNKHQTVLALMAVVLIFAACASIPPDRQVLNTIEIIRTSSISSMTVIGQLYTLGQINDSQKAQAVIIYNRLQAGCKAVAASASTVLTVQQSADLTAPLQQLADQLKALLVTFQTGGKT
jgi:hypothetical protein